ncbi:hypothetical protein ACLB2K_077284 [Fragaria x ananassa]
MNGLKLEIARQSESAAKPSADAAPSTSLARPIRRRILKISIAEKSKCDSEIYKYAMYVFRLQFVAKKLDRRLLDLGATPIVERGLGDDQHPSGYEAALDPWMASLWKMLDTIDSSYFPSGLTF